MRAGRAVVWDLDGTLAETWQDIATALNRAFSELGLPTAAPLAVRGWIGDGAEGMVATGLPTDERSPERVREVVARFRTHYSDCCVERTRLYPGIVAALDALRGTPMAVASNKPVRFVRRILDALGVGERFTLALGGDSLAVKKPSPEVLRAVAEAVGVPAERLWMIGDTPTDVRTARAVGARAIAVTWGYRPRAELVEAAPDHVVDRVEDVAALVRAA